MKIIKTLILTLSSLFFAGFAWASESPYEKENNSWITISGTVTDTNPHSFRLDYGKGFVKVEMDDWDPEMEGYKILSGDEVTVYGIVDDDVFERTTIEASSVYVENINTFFYASAVDEEDFPALAHATLVDFDVEIRGTVTDIDGREFSVATGDGVMRVDTGELNYNPLDDEGFQKIEVGDRVRVTGDIDYDWWEAREIMAESIITLASM